ncbi:Phosphomannomutase / Phosphoglucomutase [uncultured Candidatus Thioglobus sp.]|nr:Phosphomannomutase / Phosphoglucomutase [uncultured Candidatus Thioglobus sp.]SMN01392.1 Phosphomannomutase / Phosphoglucomutase [uncultured Candidatus Thioglobus sp.]
MDYPNGWGLVRPSNTTPCLVLRFEADDEKILNKIQEKFRIWLESNDIPTDSF